MNLPEREPIWIDTPETLQKLADELQKYTILAVDTESNSLFAYREQVCLVQFSTDTDDFLVDPLALPDLSPLSSIFRCPSITKVFHAAEYDLICLKRDFNFTFDNIFDTMLATRILGCKEFGLAALLENEFGIMLDKRFQRANWGMRPLPAELLDYARLDTHYLIALQKQILARLTAAGRLALAQEDFDCLCEVTVTTRDNGMAHFWRVVGNSDLNRQQLAVLYELCEYRDQIARQRNLPVFKVLAEDILLEVARHTPHNHDDLFHLHRLTRRHFKQHADGLLMAVERGLHKRPPQRPARNQPNGRYMTLLEDLRTWRKDTARQLGVESDVVLARETMDDLARNAPQTMQTLQQVMHDLPWRFEQYGQAIFHIINPPREA